MSMVATVDLPAPMPPVSPMTTTAATVEVSADRRNLLNLRMDPADTTSIAHARPHDNDELASFRPLLTAIRWGAVAVGFAVSEATHPTARNVVLGLVLGSYALVRTFWPLTWRKGRSTDLAGVLFEIVLTATVVASTGTWTSPYFFCLITAVVATAFATSAAFSLGLAATAAGAVALAYQLKAITPDSRLSVLGASEL